jgi:hypothetical protein
VGLTSVAGGLETSLGSFASNMPAVGGGGGMNLNLSTPEGTMGGVSLEDPATDAVLTSR